MNILFTVGELKKILEEYPNDMPVAVTGYENGYENFYQPLGIRLLRNKEDIQYSYLNFFFQLLPFL